MRSDHFQTFVSTISNILRPLWLDQFSDLLAWICIWKCRFIEKYSESKILFSDFKIYSATMYNSVSQTVTIIDFIWVHSFNSQGTMMFKMLLLKWTKDWIYYKPLFIPFSMQNSLMKQYCVDGSVVTVTTTTKEQMNFADCFKQ